LYLFTPPFLFFFNTTATTQIYTLSLHDALPICLQQIGSLGVLSHARTAGQAEARRHLVAGLAEQRPAGVHVVQAHPVVRVAADEDRKSTRLNSSHVEISYAVFCLKKKKNMIADK